MNKMAGLLFFFSISSFFSYAGNSWSQSETINFQEGEEDIIAEDQCSCCGELSSDYIECVNRHCEAIICDTCQERMCAINQIYYCEDQGDRGFLIFLDCTTCGSSEPIYGDQSGSWGQKYINMRARTIRLDEGYIINKPLAVYLREKKRRFQGDVDHTVLEPLTEYLEKRVK